MKIDQIEEENRKFVKMMAENFSRRNLGKHGVREITIIIKYRSGGHDLINQRK